MTLEYEVVGVEHDGERVAREGGAAEDVDHLVGERHPQPEGRAGAAHGIVMPPSTGSVMPVT